MKFIKKLATVAVSALLAGTFALSGCGLFGDNSPKSYVLQYTDDGGTHTINVTQGMPYSIESIPKKYGYDFVGLYDAQTDGTQYVGADGSSLSIFEGDKNMVLFVRYSPKKYNVTLDYQGGAVSGERQIQATYGEKLPELPLNVKAEHRNFNGWYTKANCGGVQIADKDGLIPNVSVFNESNFTLDTGVTLYAGYSTLSYSVTLNFGAAAKQEVVEVEYGTKVKDLVYAARDESGNGVLMWSKSQDGAAFDGIIDGEVTLYAKEWAPVIELDCDGGEAIAPIVAKAATSVTLPTPERELYKFLNWADESGKKAEITAMPEQSVKLKAVWQAKLVFDSNGGGDVKEISVKAGENVTLPMPERDGYIFANWYDKNGDVYTAKTMPAAGTYLKAGWYKEIVGPKVSITGSKRIQVESYDILAPTLNKFCFEVDVSNYTANGPVRIKFDAQGKYYSNGLTVTAYANFYSRKAINNDYLMAKESFDVKSSTDTTFYFNKTFTVDQNFYICMYQSKSGTWGSWITYFYYTITYPDTSELIL